MTHSIKLNAIISAAVLLLAAGCENDNKVHSEEFMPADQARDTVRLFDAEAARGAAEDGTLYACHFDGPALNSLGMAKLDAMLAAGGPVPLKVWMAVPEDEQAQSRRLSVGTFLKDRGLVAEQIQFGRGSNPAADHSAADGVKNLAAASGGDAAGGSTGASAPLK